MHNRSDLAAGALPSMKSEDSINGISSIVVQGSSASESPEKLITDADSRIYL